MTMTTTTMEAPTLPSNSFHAAIKQASATLVAASPVSASISNGVKAITVTCTIGRGDAETESEEPDLAFFSGKQYRENLVEPTLLNFDDGAGVVKPAEGWTITEQGETFKVVAAPGGRPWRWADNGRRALLRIHTIKVA